MIAMTVMKFFLPFHPVHRTLCCAALLFISLQAFPQSPPEISVPGAQSVAENTDLVFSSGNGNLVLVSDADGDDQSFTISVVNGTFTLFTSSGLVVSGDGTATISLSGPLDAVNTALNGAYFRATPDFYGSASVSFFTDDGNGGTDNESVSITVSSANQTPTGIMLSNASVAENQPGNTLVGSLTTTDPDAGDNHSYSLVAGSGSDDNAGFGISGNQLMTALSFDYEDKPSCAVRIRTTDDEGLWYEESFTIVITNVNETPTAITLSNASVPEGQPVNTVVATLSSADPDAGDVFTYSLVSGEGSTGNAGFNISGSSLLTSAVFDYETQSTYTVRLRTTDGGGLFYESVFTITVTLYNQPPSDIMLSGNLVAENQPPGTPVGSFSAVDPNTGDSHVFSLVSGNGSTDNASFAISGNQLLTAAPFNYETGSSLSIRVRATDGGSLSTEKQITITVTDVNEAPTAITLSNASVPEGQPVNTVVATLSSADPDAGDVFTYSLVSGEGSTGNALFNISGSSLLTGAVFDYETQSTYTVRLRTTDGGGLFYESVFTITVTLYNQPPSDIMLSGNLVAENQPPGTPVGSFSAVDPNTGDSHVFSLVSGDGSTDNASFTISGNQLLTAATLNYESKPSCSIRIRVTDAGGLSYDEIFSISITNVNEPPVASNVVISRANDRIGTANTGNYLYTDPETGNAMEGSSLYRWYRKSSGGGTQMIDGATATAYIPVMSDGGDSICFEVTPRDNFSLPGSPVRSSFVYVNAAPVVFNVHIHADDLRVTHYVRGRYTYSDTEGNAAGSHAWQWYRSPDPSGSGTLISEAADTVYKLRVTEEGQYIRFVITPSASSGSSPGAAVSSPWMGPVGGALPTAVISGTGTVCHNGPRAKITVNLTGEPGWVVRYRRVFGAGSEEATIRNIKTSPHIFDAPGDGTYTLLSVSDTNYSSGTVSGTAVITYFPAATARLTGTTQFCQNNPTEVPLTVDFSGTSPWTFVLRRNAQDTTYNNITQDPFVISTKRPGIYKIASLYDSHCEGDTVAGYGTAVISYIATPKAVISGIDTTCPGDTAVLRVQFEGAGPFSITYLRNGANARTISLINTLNYALKVVGNGTYTLSAVSDQVRSGCVSGTATVVYYPIPTAAISGTASICEYTSANLTVSLTGTGPWNFSYRRNAEASTYVYNAATSPRNLAVNRAGTYTLTGVSDKYCHGTVSGSAVITVTPPPDVTLTGLDPAYSDDVKMVPIFGNPKNGTFNPAMIRINDTVFFLPSYMGAGMYTIIFSYRDPSTGCYGYDTARVAVLAADAEITFPENDQKKFFCYNDPPFTILGHNTKNVTGTFTISGGKGLVDNHDNTATLYPSQLSGGTYKVNYRYFNETFLEVEESFEVESVPELQIYGFSQTSFCDDDDRVWLNGNVTGAVFTGNAVTGNASTGYYFDPGLSKPGRDTVFYTYTTARGCSRRIFRPVIIHDAANIDFTVQDTCFSASSRDSTVFINLTTTKDTIISWYWSFDDISSNENHSSLKNPRHRYTKAGLKNITLRVTTNHCESEAGKSFRFGDKPEADFDWASECFYKGRKVKFINNSSSNSSSGVTIDGYKWKFHHGTTYDSASTRDAEYLYGDTGNYRVELIIHSNYGCTDRISKILPLKPSFQLQKESSYFEGFENGRAGWLSTAENTVNSWVLGTPQDPYVAAAEGDYAWYTHIIAERPPKEQSYVTSPCFSFSGIEKPMIKLNLWRLFDQSRDGANLQYRSDSNKIWQNLGKLEDGINWYNNYEISGNPGGRSTGWSSSNTVSTDIGWIEARHSLDELKGKKDVQFRIAYGSDSTATGTHGLAFDNMRIGDRSKIVLIEHFTNAGDAASRSADSILDVLAGSYPFDVVDIQYHTSFPGPDPFNEQNKIDPGTRVLFYQLSGVPYSIINGGTFLYDYSDNNYPDPGLIRNLSLTDPDFNISLHTETTDDALNIDAEFRSLIPVRNKQISLYIVIIERIISGISGDNGDSHFESVLKKILSGTSYNHNWDPADKPIALSGEWTFKNTYNTDELRVIAFIQDEATHEIYQAVIDKFDVPLALGENKGAYPGHGSRSFIAFPNPVHHEVYIRFDEALPKEAQVDLFDINGRLMMTSALSSGIKLHAINLESFPEGLYFMRIAADSHFVGLQKLLISR